MSIIRKQYVDFKVYSVTHIKNKYGYRIKLLFEDDTDRLVQKSGFKTKKLANEDRNRSITDLYNRDFVVDSTIKTKEFFIYWLEEVMKPSITANSYDSYKNVVYNHLIPELGEHNLNKLTKAHIRLFYEKMAKFSHSITKLCKCVIDGGMAYAKKYSLIRDNFTKDIDLPKGIKKKKYREIEIDTTKTYNLEQVKLLIRKSKETPIYLHILFATLMGLRKSEINGLKYSDMDFENKTLKIERQLGRKPNTSKDEVVLGEFTKQEIPPKTFSSKREVLIPDLVFEAILEQKEIYEKNKRRRINDKTTPFKDYGFICCSTYGNPRSRDFHYQHYKELIEDCGLPYIRFHDLRHTYSTLLLKSGFSVKAISKLLGHATEIISMDVYGDNQEIIAAGVDEIVPFIERVIPKKKEREVSEDDELFNNIDQYIRNLVVKLV